MNARRRAILRGLQGLVIVPLVLLVSAGAAWAGPKTVDCAKGQTITHALEQSDGNPITIEVRGTCHESVQIDRDDVTLIAGSAGGTVNGPDPNTNTINVVGASRVVIDGLTVTGGRNGIAANGASRLTIQNCSVQRTGRTGISFFQGSSGTANSCTVQDNPRDGISVEGGAATVINSTISGNGRTGIIVHNGGSARIGITNRNDPAGNMITGNSGSGIGVANGGSAYLADNTISGNGIINPASTACCFGLHVTHATASLAGGNTISGNAGSGVFVRAGSVLIGDPGFDLPTGNIISDNGASNPTRGGIQAFQGGMADVRDATITGNHGGGAQASENGVIELRNSTIGASVFVSPGFDGGHGVVGSLRSTVRLRGGSIVQNNAGDGVRITNGSAADFRGAPDPASSVTGNTGFGLNCFGADTFYSGNTSGVTGNGAGQISGTCTLF